MFYKKERRGQASLLLPFPCVLQNDALTLLSENSVAAARMKGMSTVEKESYLRYNLHLIIMQQILIQQKP